MLDHIHRMVVSIVQGLPLEVAEQKPKDASVEVVEAQTEQTAPEPTPAGKKPRHRVDVTG
jgi:hypothetical protein